ncbi:MAG: biotin transporter BioY [Candidatus Gastranaerophilales bacterium]|nr:biotin transporter BioY [Candidatus Gastranaerophilales bacterium]
MNLINKRYIDIFEQYIHKGESTPFTIGTLVVCALCFLILIIATFTQITFSHPWIYYSSDQGFIYAMKTVAYNPQFPVMIFIIYLLYKSYSFLVYISYLLCGFFIYPIFAFGGGLDYVQNYFFGYLLGFIFAILITGKILKADNSVKSRIIAGTLGILSIHITGFVYCIFLAVFKVIDFNMITPIFQVLTASKIIYDILFSILALLIAPYIKNVLWVCMRPISSSKKKLKNSHKRNEIVSDNAD